MPTASAQVTFRVAGVPKIAISASAVSATVDVGQYAKATVTLQNSGSATANVTVSATDTVNGSSVGGWNSATASVAPGKKATLNMQTTNPIPSNLASNTVTATFSATY